ncbi:MAG: class I SAM-dependent methyltransferase [Sulfuritalea sp.]|nr:class I SAM-dependent methyltransferase [Sulfuritalea sp.]
MNISDPSAKLVCDELELITAELPLENAQILELGCGKAEKTRGIARFGKPSGIVALEVDVVQHANNLKISDLPTVRFRQGAAEKIPADDASFDIVMMFKSLHHVPADKMDQALSEIRRVLKPGGLAWISEPVYAGEFNEILRLFHDEREVREAAFKAVRSSVEDGRFTLVGQRFFSTPGHFDDFAQFEDRVIKVTHTQHRLAPELHDAVRRKFESYLTASGANFANPLRVDILKKPIDKK